MNIIIHKSLYLIDVTLLVKKYICIDSISHGPVSFIGQVSDDYAVDKLQLVYYNKNDKSTLKKKLITISKEAGLPAEIYHFKASGRTKL